MKIKNNRNFYLFLSIIFIFIILLYIIQKKYNNHYKYKQKTISIFGSVSKDIKNDINLLEDLRYLALNLNKKYNYIIPNSREGLIGFLLENIREIDKNNILTTYSKTFHKNNINRTYKIKYFNDPIDFEEFMIRNSSIYIFLPGGLGTLYEIFFTLFLLDVSDDNNKVIFYNKNNYYNFINIIMNNLNKSCYLRENIYKKFKNNCYFINNINEINKII